MTALITPSSILIASIADQIGVTAVVATEPGNLHELQDAAERFQNDGRTAEQDKNIKAHFGNVPVRTSAAWREKHL